MTQIIVQMDLAEWLILSGKGQAQNFSFQIPAGAAGGVQSTKLLQVPQGYDMMLIYGVQFDGVLSGQITFQITGTQGSTIGGYAVQSFVQEECLITDPGQSFLVTTISTQSQIAVMNVDYVAFHREVWNRDVLPFLIAHIPGGR